ncbi:zinc-dependent alcohol dehydrogenase [Rhodococcus opacus]|uniref:zinc-dependent alcohol dehydrogenase n=1 Tax=Rhodococcus opacus TaxID=37919 RepID=UPI001C47E0A0|nr:medium chain dehydrogenase/reductase family protein [Rhodococcus opacus]MBV6759864.1 alcohol dehydrogenase catalytic domain-containing protein [Rhodococcus opacus]
MTSLPAPAAAATGLTLSVDILDGAITPFVHRGAPRAMGPRDLIVRLAFVGICGTDAEILHGRMPDTFRINYPHSLGHEWSGTVESVGAEVTEFRRGDRVLGHGHLGGNDWFGVTHDGAAAEFFTVPADLCFHVPPTTSMLSAAVIEPFACVLQALTTIGGVSAADTVHIHGLGAIGLNALMQTRHSGAQVIVFDPSPIRRQRALELGAIGALDPTLGTVPDLAASICGRPYADLVIEASGSPVAQANALEGAGVNGRILLMGVSRPTPAPARLGLIQERDLIVRTSIGAPAAIWPAAIRYVGHSGLDLSAIVSAVFPLSAGVAALDAAQDTRSHVKVMLEPDSAVHEGRSLALASPAREI